jgi:hypothetical protein
MKRLSLLTALVCGAILRFCCSPADVEGGFEALRKMPRCHENKAFMLPSIKLEAIEVKLRTEPLSAGGKLVVKSGR